MKVLLAYLLLVVRPVVGTVSFSIYLGHCSPDFHIKRYSVILSGGYMLLLNCNIECISKCADCEDPDMNEEKNRSIEEISTSYLQIWMKRIEGEAEQMTQCIMSDSVSRQRPVPVESNLLVPSRLPLRWQRRHLLYAQNKEASAGGLSPLSLACLPSDPSSPVP